MDLARMKVSHILFGGPEMTTTFDTHEAIRVAWPLPGWMYWILKRFYWHSVWWVVMVPEDGTYQTIKIDTIDNSSSV